MKKLILAILSLGVAVLHAQNPTLVVPTNGIQNATTAISGKVQPRLFTNSQNNAVQQVYGHSSAGAFGWIDTSSFAGGLPTNWTWSASLLTNTTLNGSFDIATTGGQTNSAASFFGRWPGAITFGTAADYQLRRDSTGRGWSFILTPNVNIDVLVGGSFGLRGTPSTGGTIGSQDGQTIYSSDATAGNITHVLPAVNLNAHKIFHFYKKDTTTNTSTIATASGTLMSNGKTNVVLGVEGQTITFWNNSATSTWDILDSYTAPASSWSANPLSARVVAGAAIIPSIEALNILNMRAYQTVATNADSFAWSVSLKSKTNYVLKICHETAPYQGTRSIYIGPVFVASQDTYTAGGVHNVVSAWSNIFLPYDGEYIIRSVVTGRNGSSTGHFIVDEQWQLYAP